MITSKWCLVALVVATLVAALPGCGTVPSISGRVLAVESGQPVAGALVTAQYTLDRRTLLRWQGASMRWPDTLAYTDADGMFTFPARRYVNIPYYRWLGVVNVRAIHPYYAVMPAVPQAQIPGAMVTEQRLSTLEIPLETNESYLARCPDSRSLNPISPAWSTYVRVLCQTKEAAVPNSACAVSLQVIIEHLRDLSRRYPNHAKFLQLDASLLESIRRQDCPAMEPSPT